MTKRPWELKVIFNSIKICSASDMNWYLLGVEMNLGHAHKTKFWYLLGVFSKFSDEHPVTFIGEYPPSEFPRQTLLWEIFLYISWMLLYVNTIYTYTAKY